ncbi:hypothetical protein AAKU61_004341 [Undibacterium sp. GrIS 1.2]|uniref:hypothetical protein n=1 Tax=Undibacterium sp. GrIS 1.2 TaxID=3143933 RepID=UPI003396791C
MKNDEKQYQKGKMYQYNGAEFVELEPSNDIKLPVSEEAMEAVKSVRKATHSLIKLRPELSLTASAMLIEASKLLNIAEVVQKYGQQVYSKTESKGDNSLTAGDTAGQGT